METPLHLAAWAGKTVSLNTLHYHLEDTMPQLVQTETLEHGLGTASVFLKIHKVTNVYPLRVVLQLTVSALLEAHADPDSQEIVSRPTHKAVSID